MCDLAGDFPNLPRRNNQNHQAVTQQTENPQTETQTSALTQDTMAKFRADLKTEFTEMIKKEVKSQIQHEMAAMQESVNQAATKLDAFQGSICDAIGSAIRESLQGAQPQHPAQQHQPPTQQCHQQVTQVHPQPPTNQSQAPTPSQKTLPQTQKPDSSNMDAEIHDQGPHSQQTMGAQN
jgi:hypothetical protein